MKLKKIDQVDGVHVLGVTYYNEKLLLTDYFNISHACFFCFSE